MLFGRCCGEKIFDIATQVFNLITNFIQITEICYQIYKYM